MENQLNIDTQNFTKSEIIIWDYFKNNLNTSIYMTISQIAEACYVSEATITRFVRKLGYESFQEFKISLIQVHQSNAFNNDAYQQALGDFNNPWLSEAERIAQHLYEDINNSLLYAITNLNFNDLEALVIKIMHADNVIICGFASSGVVAQEFFYRLTRLGIQTQFVLDPHMLSFLSANLQEDDLVVFISHTGDNIEQIKAAKLLKENNVAVAAITANIMSPLARASKFVLMYSAVDQVINFYDIPAYMTIIQTFIIDLITLYIKHLDQEQSQEENLKTIKAIESITR